MYPQFAVILCTTRFVSPYEAICTEHYTQHLVNMLPHPSLQLFPTNAIYDQPVATCTLEIRHNCSSSPQATGSPCDALLPHELQGTPRRRGRCLHASSVTAFSNQMMKPCQYWGKNIFSAQRICSTQQILSNKHFHILHWSRPCSQDNIQRFQAS